EGGEEERRRAGDVRRRERALAVDGTETVIVTPLVLVGQDGVGDRQLLEALLGRLVARVAIGVPLQRQLAIRNLDLGVGRAAADTQRFVIIGRQGDYPSDSDVGDLAPADTDTIAGRNSRSPPR